MVECIVNALTEGSISIIKDKYRKDWKTSIENDDIITMHQIVENSMLYLVRQLASLTKVMPNNGSEIYQETVYQY